MIATCRKFIIEGQRDHIPVRKERDAEQGRREDVSINGELNINGAARNFAAQRDLPKRRTNAAAKRESVESLEET